MPIPRDLEPATKAVVFDVYNTLFDNGRQVWARTFDALCREQGISLAPEELYQRWRALDQECRKQRVNLEAPHLSPPFRPYRDIWLECFVRLFRELGLDADPARANARVLADLARRPLYPESLPVVTQLHAWHKTAILSNADRSFLSPLLEGTTLPLDVVISSETVGAYKPHPLPFQRVLEVLEVEPHEAVFVGDTLYDDILGAQRAGMRTVWINWSGAPGDTALVRPDHQVDNLTQLLDLLRPKKGDLP